MSSALDPILEERQLAEEEYSLVRWVLEHGVPEARFFLPQLDQARVISRCGCGCASLNFEVAGEPVIGPFILGDFLYGSEDAPLGLFVFQRSGRLAGVEVYGLAGDAPLTLPRVGSLRPYESRRA